MGTEVDPSDMDHVVALADQVVELSAYRTRLADYLRTAAAGPGAQRRLSSSRACATFDAARAGS